MPIPQIEQLRNLGDFATTYHWALEVASSPAVVTLDEGFNLRCSSVDIPKSTNEPMIVDVRGIKVKQHGITTPSQEITLELNETVDNFLHKIIHDWREGAWDAKSGGQNTMKDVKGDFLLQRYANDRKTIIWTYKLVGVFLQDYDIPQLNGESDTLKPSITLSYDYFTEGEGSNAG